MQRLTGMSVFGHFAFPIEDWVQGDRLHAGERLNVAFLRFPGKPVIAVGLRSACALLFMPALLWADGDIGSGVGSRVRVIMPEGATGAIRLEARQARLGQMLDRIADETGVRIHYPLLPEGLQTVTCVGQTVKEVVECLLGPEADLIARYAGTPSKEGSGARPSELWVLGTSFVSDQASADTWDGRCAGPDTEQAAERCGRRQGTVEPEDAGQLLERATSKDPALRSDAIAHLPDGGRVDDATVRRTLEAALSDADASVRAQAVHGLARIGGVDAMAMLHEALHDRDASVRLMAVDSAGTDAQGIALLREALADSDETVRAFAATKLEPLSDSESVR
jgi:hypothetical protein